MRAADADILIVPGLGGSGPDHWQSRWEKKLSTARRVEQRDWNTPNRLEWVDVIVREAMAGARPVIIVAHSLGVIASLHAAPRLGDMIAAGFFVAPPSEQAMREMREIDDAFLPIPRAPLAFPSLLVGGHDDPYADILFQRRLAEEIGAKFIDAGASGHINEASGHGPWPEGLLSFAGFISKL